MVAETKKEQKKVGEGNVITRTLSTVRTYFGEVRSELNKVSWPDREDVVRLTRIVLAVTVVSSLVMGALSVLFSLLTEYGIQFPLIFVVLFAVIIAGTIYLFRRDSQKAGY